jgi:hypothetical protein
MPVSKQVYSNRGRVMALSEAQIKKNKEANKRAKEKRPFRGYDAGPSKETIEKRARSAKNKLAATAMADTEVEATISAFEGDLKRAKTFNAKDKVLARFLKRAEAQQKMTKKKKDKARKDIAQFKRDNKEIEAGIDSNKVLDRQRRLTKAYGGKAKMAGGGDLKDVPSGNKGLGKLPTAVRNKMGFKKYGGKAKMMGGGKVHMKKYAKGGGMRKAMYK